MRSGAADLRRLFLLRIFAEITMGDDHNSTDISTAIGWLAQLCSDAAHKDTESQSVEMRQARAVFQSLVDALPINLLVKDSEGRRIFANRGYLELHDVTLDSILGKTDFDLFPEEMARRLSGEDAQVLRTGKPFFATETRKMQGGKRLSLERAKAPLRDADGNIVGVQVLFQDETDRLHTQQALDLERDLLQSLMENIPDAIYFKDQESRFLRLSKAHIEKFNLVSHEEAIGKTDADIFTEEHAQQALADEKEVMRTGKPLVGRLEKETWPDRPPTWVSSTKVPLRNRNGEIVGTFGISRDISELKSTQDELQKARDEARAANRAKSDFLANVSHELRTPMNGIIGMTELLLNTDLSSEQREYQTVVKSSAEALMSLLNDILDFSKIEAGKLELELVPFDLRETLGATLRILAARGSSKGLELAVHIPAEAPNALRGDPVRLRQVIVNLVGNAIKFTKRGEVVVSVRAESTVGDRVLLRFKVRDTGIGIAEKDRDRIFDAFTQADASTTREYGGTGLGLAIASQLVRLMGGNIWVESQVGQGSSFYFTAEYERIPGDSLPDPANLKGLKGLPVLIVDDNETNRFICAELIKGWGMTASSAASGEEAISAMREAAQQGKPVRLVLLDVMMPEMDGFQVAKRIQSSDELNNAVVILLSSAGRAEDLHRAEEVGVARCLTKPVTQSDLLDAVSQAMGSSVLKRPTNDTINANRPASFRPRRVLLAEDGAVNQQVAVRLLQKRGHHVDVVENGRDAVQAQQLGNHDVVLMDVQMPIMDGFEATAEIREKEGESRHVRIVAMTAHAMSGDRQRCLDAGMDDYLSKPFQPHELFRVVEHPLDEEGEEHDVARSVPAMLDSSTGGNSEIRITPPVEPPKAQTTETANAANGAPADAENHNVAEAFDQPEALKRVGGSDELLQEMIQLFLEQCPLQVDAVHEAKQSGDPEQLGRAAHSLKGSLSMLAAHPAYEIALRIEKMARSGDAAETDAALSQLDAEIDRLTTALKSSLKQ